MTERQRLDVSRDRCPMTWVRTKVALERLPAGSCLEVVLGPGEMLLNVPRSCAEDGYEIVALESIDGDRHLMTVRTRGA